MAARTLDNRGAFSRAVRSFDDGYGGADLAIWLEAPVPLDLSATPVAARPFVVVAFPQATAVSSGFVSLGALHALKGLHGEVEIASPRAMESEPLRELAKELGYEAEIPGQVTGYWFGPGELVPATKPHFRETGAVLVRRDDARVALDLVEIEYEWLPVSTAAIPTYNHTSGLRHGEVWRFVVFGAGGVVTVRTTRQLREITLVNEGIYGAEAYRRARHDRPAIELVFDE